jgi:N6-adenosine-specific RNA methylase IME4
MLGKGDHGGDRKSEKFKLLAGNLIEIPKQDRHKFRLMAEHRSLVEELIEEGTTGRAQILAQIKIESIKARANSKGTKSFDGLYDVLVIDPPWPMRKIDREVRPNQSGPPGTPAGGEYSTMTEEQLEAIRLPLAETCHVWLWTTHRFLPMAFRLLEAWGLEYSCLFVWHKPGAFQPFGLPQFNCEFALYARRGSPTFTDTKAFKTCFSALRGQHSQKPESFYRMVRRVTAGRRLDMFNRREIEGFDRWGDEA